MRIVAGNAQTARVSELAPGPLIVSVVDRSGHPVEGVTVFWTAHGGGSVDPEAVVTDFSGRALAYRLLGPTAGDQTTTAAVGEAAGIPPATFTTTAVAED
jgi:Bacterial Ig-like domain (group 1)